ncbi:MAG: hypothetical protein ACRYGA_01140 [Janthinobacterium lividum]
MIGKLLEVGFPLAGDGDGGLQLGDHLAHGRDLGLASGQLGGELRQLRVDIAPFGAELRLGGAGC